MMETREGWTVERARVAVGWTAGADLTKENNIVRELLKGAQHLTEYV